MKRITTSLRCVLHSRLHCRAARRSPRTWRSYQASSPLCSSSDDGRDHDDFWTSVKTEAESTPAFRKAASVGTSISSPSSAEWATPGGDGRQPARPAGQAYQRYNEDPVPVSGEPRQHNPYNPDQGCVFDMSSPMHLSRGKQVTVSSFNGRMLVDIRQYFKNLEGATLPTKKGISLTIPQWRRLREAMDEIDSRAREGDEDASEPRSQGSYDDRGGHGSG